MGDLVNLRLKRKAKSREEAAEKASENRASFGRRKDEKKLTTLLNSNTESDLDGHKREE